MSEGTTLTLSDLLASHGLEVQAVASGRSIDTFVRDVYSALSDGISAVYVFTDKVDDSLLSAFASLDTVEAGTALVVTANSGDDCATLRRKIDYRNDRNVNAKGKARHGKVTLGSCTLGENFRNSDADDADPIGFVVRP